MEPGERNCPECNKKVFLNENGSLTRIGVGNIKNLFNKPKRKDWIWLIILAITFISAWLYYRDITSLKAFYETNCYCPFLENITKNIINITIP